MSTSITAPDKLIDSPVLPKPVPAQGPTDLKRQVDAAALTVLLQRVQDAKNSGAVNVAVNVDFLLELLRGSHEAVRSLNWKLNTEI
jgi:hypothetical protein